MRMRTLNALFFTEVERVVSSAMNMGPSVLCLACRDNDGTFQSFGDYNIRSTYRTDSGTALYLANTKNN